ncbi:MAG TPA: GNAT family N-acetyltransferase [Actinomycetota bacterium]|nr:GNAT family N-acetyltransferase [Actinomycetota bacterium]
MTIRIREADPTDAEAIAGIHVRSWQTAYRGLLTDEYLDGLSVEERLEQHRGALSAPGEHRTWVAEEGGTVVGFAVTGPSQDADADEKTGELYAIYLEPDRLGQGVGKLLSDHATRDLRERGFQTATLWVLGSNEGARRFYEREGWSADGLTTSERVDCEMRPTVRYRTSLV